MPGGTASYCLTFLNCNQLFCKAVINFFFLSSVYSPLTPSVSRIDSWSTKTRTWPEYKALTQGVWMNEIHRSDYCKMYSITWAMRKQPIFMTFKKKKTEETPWINSKNIIIGILWDFRHICSCSGKTTGRKKEQLMGFLPNPAWSSGMQFGILSHIKKDTDTVSIAVLRKSGEIF